MGDQVSKTKWKVFFWIIFILEILTIISMVNDPKESRLNTVLEIIIYGTIIIGLFGFAWNRKLLSPKFWAIMIPIGLIYDIYDISTFDMSFESKVEMYFVIAFSAAIIIPLLFFQYLALFKYSFKSKELWQQ